MPERTSWWKASKQTTRYSWAYENMHINVGFEIRKAEQYASKITRKKKEKKLTSEIDRCFSCDIAKGKC